MKGRASMVGVVRGTARNDIRMLIVSDTEKELASAMSAWTKGQRQGEAGLFLSGSLFHGKSHAEVFAHVRAMIGPEIAAAPSIPRVSVPALPQQPILPQPVR